MSAITFILGNPDRTGASRMALSYATRLAEHGHSVSLIHGWGGEGQLKERPAQSLVPEFERAGVSCVPLDSLARPVGRGFRRSLDRHLARFSPAAIVAVNQRDRAAGIEAARRLGVPSIVMAQNQHTFSGPAAIGSMKRLYYKRAIQRCDLIVCSSAAVGDELAAMFGVASDRMIVINNGIDVDRYTHDPVARDRVRRELQVGDRLLLVCVGRLDPQKGQDILVDALRELSDEELARLAVAVVGDIVEDSRIAETRHYVDRLHGEISDAGLGEVIDFLGWRDDVPALLSAADVFVLPSRWEGWSLALVEAMAASLPLVASDCSGRPVGFEDGTQGVIVPSGRSAALSDGLKRVLALTGEELADGGVRNRRTAEQHYDIDLLSDRFVGEIEVRLDGLSQDGSVRRR